MVDWPKGGRGWVAEALSFHIVLVQGRFFGRCCRIAVSSVDGMRRLSPFYVNNDQEGITKVGWMIIIHISHACISVCDGLQRRAGPYWTNSRGRGLHILSLPPAHWSVFRLKPVGTHHCNGNDNDHSSHPTSTVVPLGIYCKTQFKQDLE